MRLADLTEVIIEKVQDPSIDEKRIRRIINQGIEQAASEINDPLPDLETIETVTTVTNRAWVNLPADFHREFDWCFSAARNDKVEIYKGLPYLRSADRWQGGGWENLDKVGTVYGVARSGGRLYYQGIPETADTLTLHYFRMPTLLYKDKDVPSDFPSYSHEELFVNFACKELFSEIEDGIEGPKTNTDYYTALWKEAMQSLETFIGPRDTEPPQIHDMLKEILY